MASGAFQEIAEIAEIGDGANGATITFKSLDIDFTIEEGQEYILLERQGKLYDWPGNALDLSEIYEIKPTGCVRIKVGLPDKNWENLYFKVTEVGVNGDKDRFKGIGYDVYGPNYTGLIDKEIEFESKHIIEIWWKSQEARDKYELEQEAKDWILTSEYYCNGCEESIFNPQPRYHCLGCDDFDLCQKCFKNKGHEHKMDRFKQSGRFWHADYIVHSQGYDTLRR